MIKIKHRRLRLVGKWLFAGGVLAAVAYPIIISPMLDPKPYKELQKVGRKDIVQKDVQPGNMRIWSDPFARQK